MDRREFIKKTLSLGAAAVGYALLPETVGKLIAGEQAVGVPDIVAIKGGEAAEMFEAGIKAIGGMERFVKKGQKVVVKPNIGWDVAPEFAANTNPQLVAKIVEYCYKAGAEKVYVLDHTCDYGKNCYKNSGIEEAAKNAGAEVLNAGIPSMYVKVKNSNAKYLKETSIHKVVMESDVLINVPILKHHEGSGITIAMKNLMGIVWDRRIYHSLDLHHTISDFCFYKKPDLNIVDAYRVLTADGPRGTNDAKAVSLMKMQLISTDIVAIDAAASKIFGIEPSKVDYIKYAHEKKIGNMNIDTLNIKKISL